MSRLRILLIGCLMIAQWLNPGATVSACSTPVFRYALEMWPAFDYQVKVIITQDLNADQEEALKMLQSANSGAFKTNVVVQISKDPTNYGIESLSNPQILILAPTEQKGKDIIWKGDLNIENAKRVINSPARSAIIENIRKGDAITWVLLEGSDPVKNDKAKQTLKKELDRLSKELMLASDATDVDGNPLDINIIKKGVSFSMITIDRQDRKEEIFANTLLHSEPDLPFIKAPIAFPIFGRGRVLYALVGNGIKPKLIQKTCETVIGWCSCTIKEDNPGADLLFTANWEAVAGDSTWVKPVELPEISGLSGFVQEEAEMVSKVDKKENKTEVQNEEVTPAVINKQTVTPKESIQSDDSQKETGQSELNLKSDAIEEGLVNQRAVKGKTLSPLTRNLILVLALVLIGVFGTSYYLRKRKA